jgi:Bacterial Ig domain/RTX calcium-binding nonapeptide repeat (4 copies)
VVKAGAGDDTLCGGPGKDKLLGGPGVDTCVGGPGKDKLKGCEPAGGPPGGAAPPTVNQSPVANADSFNGIGNTGLFVGTSKPANEAGKEISGSVLSNDTDPETPAASLTVTSAVDQGTLLGGTVTIESDGNFTYQPPADTTGVSDSFTYAVSDGIASSSGAVTVPLAGQAWYVKNNATAGGDGTSDGPFDTIAEAETASSAGDTVYVFDGDNTSTGYATGYTMESAERLMGEASGFTLDPDGGGPQGTFTLHSGTTGAFPTLTDTNADVVALASGAEVRGFNLDPSGTGGGIAGVAGVDSARIGRVNVVDTGTAGTEPGIELDSTTGTFDFSDLTVSTSAATGMRLNNAGAVAVTGSGNSINSVSATALTVTSTTIGAGGLTFQSISAGNNTVSADPENGIVLSATGSNGGLTVTGSGSTAQGGDNSGGTIQSTTGHGISLANTIRPSFRNMRLLNTGDSGVNGTQVSGFSFIDGTITGAGDASDENSVTFDDSVTTTPNLTGGVTITNNVISQTEAGGIDIHNSAGTISDANVSDNALSDSGDVATPGPAVSLIGFGTPTTSASITRATIAANTITDFRAGFGVEVRAGNPNAAAPAGHAGAAGSATDVIAVTGNLMNGGNGGVGNQPDRFFTGGKDGSGQGNFNVSNNGTPANRIRNIDCIAIELQANGPANMTSTVQNNFINPNNVLGCAGIAVGTDDPFDLGAGTHTTTISGNNVMGTDGPGIFPIVRDSSSTMVARVLNNTVAAPIATNAARAGIRVDSGSASGDTTFCLEISGNTTAGSTNAGTATTSPGINLRKQGTDPTINTFGIEGMAATASPGVENYVNGLNTSSSGTFGVGGTALLSAQSGFTNCNAP